MIAPNRPEGSPRKNNLLADWHRGLHDPPIEDCHNHDLHENFQSSISYSMLFSTGLDSAHVGLDQHLTSFLTSIRSHQNEIINPFWGTMG